MALQANGDLLLVGRGKVFIKRLETAGVGSGYRFVGQNHKFEMKMNIQKETEYSSVEASAPAVKEFVGQTSPTVGLALKEMDADNLSLATMGTKAKYTQAATAITNEVFLDVKQGTFLKLAKRGPISAVLVEPSPTGSAFVLGTDYSIEDASIPLIKIIEGGGIVDGADIQVDYTPTAITAPNGLDQVRGGTSPIIECSMLFVPDPASGPKWQCEIWKASLTSDAVISMIQEGLTRAVAELSGTVLSDAANHPNDPYFLLTRLP